MGCEDVYVTVDGIPYQQGSRTSIIPGGNTVISVGGEYRVYTYSQIEGFKADKETLPERVDNINKVTLDYRAIAEVNTTYTFYPLFWNANFSHTFDTNVMVNTAGGTTKENLKQAVHLRFKWENNGHIQRRTIASM